MEPKDYRHWMKCQKEVTVTSGSDSTFDTMLDDVLFDAVSKRAWMDLLLQIIKVVVCKICTPINLSELLS